MLHAKAANEMNDRPLILVSSLAQNKKINYSKLKLTGTKSNRDGLGAIVRLTAGGQTQQHEGKSGYFSQSSLPLYFGLGAVTKIDRIEITWPSGKKQLVEKDLAPNTLLNLVEPKD